MTLKVFFGDFYGLNCVCVSHTLRVKNLRFYISKYLRCLINSIQKSLNLIVYILNNYGTVKITIKLCFTFVVYTKKMLLY